MKAAILLTFSALLSAEFRASHHRHAAPIGTSGRNDCCAPPRSPAESSSGSGSSAFLRARTLDGAADILPARHWRQENRKWMSLGGRWLSAGCLGALCAAWPFLFC